jgi:hypothetical protein
MNRQSEDLRGFFVRFKVVRCIMLDMGVLVVR